MLVDPLRGGNGSETYLFGLGDGQDTINNDNDSYYAYADPDTAKEDALVFKDVNYQDLWFSQAGNNLVVTVAGTDDKVTVNNWYSGDKYELDSIQAGSSVLLNSQVEQLVAAMASYDVPSGAGAVISQDVVAELQPILAETWENTSV